MSVNDRRVFAMALVLVALMSIFVPVASAGPGSQTWYLYSNFDLKKNYPADTSYDLQDWRVWACGPAQCDLTMGAGTWTVYLDYYAACDGKVCFEVMKYGDPNVEIADIYNRPISSGSGTKSVDINQHLIDGDFAAGDTLKLHFAWHPDTGQSGDLTVYCGDGKSTFSSPSTDPGYPVPEMSTVALFSIGLLALAGYVVYRRREI